MTYKDVEKHADKDANKHADKNLDARNRSHLLQEADKSLFDLAVIGGGITGAGIVRDAAMRGLKVALVEARDFASGTSSRSSKMIHGGLRYLAQGNIGLVREAARERLILREIAPHLAQVEPFVLLYRSLAASAKIKAGLVTFEKLGGVAKSERHNHWSKSELRRREPAVLADDLKGAYVYHECLTDDARLTLANIRSAKAHGALVLSYAAATGFVTERGRAVGIKVAGQLPDETAEVVIRARYIVNAAGPWVDSVMALEDERHKPRLQLTKGIHLVFDHKKLPVNRTTIVPASDKRSVFAVPRDGYTYFGTTDTFYDKTDYWPEVDSDSIDYILQASARSFSVPRLERSDIKAAWAGIRPLIAQEGKAPSEISRANEIWTGRLGILTIAGGKLSAYRKMAERIVDRVQEDLGIKPAPSATAKAPLPGGSCTLDELRRNNLLKNMEPVAAGRLLRLYGDEYSAILDAGGNLEAEVQQAVTCEGALRLEDYWMRRGARAWFSKHEQPSDLELAGAKMAGLLGWSDSRTQLEIKNCVDLQNRSLAAINKKEA